MVNSSAYTTFPSTRGNRCGDQSPSRLSASRGLCGPGRRCRGFGLVELMIGLVLASILMGIGLPMFRGFITDQRLRATSSDLRIAVMTARSEAVKRNRTVELKPTAGGWGDGWTIPSPIDGDPDILSFKQSGDVTITTIGALEAKFTPMGRVLSPVDFEIDVGPDASGSLACLQLQLDGRIVSLKGACPNG
jgi:type IV fimbrial biogenesis protein FimT